MKRFLTTSVFCVAASMAVADVPQQVIDECNKANSESYDEMPSCLKNGVIAYEMLGLALQGEFYGPSAQRVIDLCRDKNDTYETVWICFENAAEQAAETRRMIGIENMKDACFVSISDPDAYDPEVPYVGLEVRRHGTAC